MNMFKIFPMVVSLLLLPFFLNGMIGDTPINWEELALGKETFSPHVFLEDGTRVYAKNQDQVVHCSSIENCFKNFSINKKTPVVLWLGNSQLHAINQYKETDVLASEILHNNLKKDGYDLLTISHPSANLQEHYTIAEYAKLQLGLDSIIIGVVFDDFREDGVRNDIGKFLKDKPLSDELKATKIGRKIINNYKEVLDTQDDYGALRLSFQDKAERFLNEKLESISEIWGRRPYLRGLVFNTLYKTRNYVFNINPSTKRKMIKPRFKDNWNALESLIDSYVSSGINVFVYIAPIRGDVEIPYLPNEYDKFKLELTLLASKKGFNLMNYEDLVPAQFWGLKDSTNIDGSPELDFMHYQYGGHKILSDQIYKDLKLEELR